MKDNKIKETLPPDELLLKIADYVSNEEIKSDLAYQTARYCLADSMGCAILALNFPKCTNLLGPVIPGTTVPYGTVIPGTSYILDPITGAFNIGSMIRWLDYNDTWLAAEWGHPSDNLGGILAVTDHLCRKAKVEGKKTYLVKDVLTAMIKAYEIQGILALGNCFNKIGLDHVILVKIATSAVVTKLLGGSRDQILATLSNAWIDSGPLRTYRHAPNTGSRKSWAAGDATSRGVFLSHLTMKGEMGYKTALSTPTWGFCDAINKGKKLVLERELSSYVMENILFKVAFPAEFHAQTAVECAIKHHLKLINRFNEIDVITIETQEPAIRIIDKTGPLHNPADRDHCLQYMVAIALIKGSLQALDYEEKESQNPLIDILRSKMIVVENKQYSIDYLDPNKRSIANAITIKFKDGTISQRIEIEYPYGHRKRREEGLPLLFEKLITNLRTQLPEGQVGKIVPLLKDHESLCELPVSDFIDLFAKRLL